MFADIRIYSHHDRAGILSTNSFSLVTLPVQPIQATFTSVALGDIDRDGYLDIFGYQGLRNAVFWNRTGGAHIASNHFPRVQLSAPISLPLFGLFDVNGDARPDIMFGPQSYIKNSTGNTPGVIVSDSLTVRLNYGLSQQAPVTSADLNADGLPDFVLTGRGDVLNVLENVCHSAPVLGQVVLTNSRVQIRAYGLPGQGFHLERSSDLSKWLRHDTSKFNSSGEASFSASAANRNFFRLAVIPPR